METVIYWLGVLTLCIGVPTLTMRVVDWLDKLHSNNKKGGLRMICFLICVLIGFVATLLHNDF